MSDLTSWSERYAAAAMVWDTNPNQFVVEACSKLRPGRALDLGAGEGRNAIWLAGRGWKVTAVDFASIAVGRISSRAALQGVTVDAIVADALTYQPKPASLDLVLLSYLQLPMPALRKVLGNIATGLSVGGRLVLVAPTLPTSTPATAAPRIPTGSTTRPRWARRPQRRGWKWFALRWCAAKCRPTSASGSPWITSSRPCARPSSPSAFNPGHTPLARPRNLCCSPPVAGIDVTS